MNNWASTRRSNQWIHASDCLHGYLPTPSCITGRSYSRTPTQRDLERACAHLGKIERTILARVRDSSRIYSSRRPVVKGKKLPFPDIRPLEQNISWNTESVCGKSLPWLLREGICGLLTVLCRCHAKFALHQASGMLGSTKACERNNLLPT